MRGLLKIVTDDLYLGQKLRLELCEDFDRTELLKTAEGSADLWIIDCRCSNARKEEGTALYIGAEDGSIPEALCLPLPLPIGLAAKKIKNRKKPPLLMLLSEERAVRLRGEHIRLTEVELSLLSALLCAKGGYISREALRAAVWGEEGTDSLLNVYIHYLREKLEGDGEKVILSSRKLGYALAEKFVKGEEEC